MRGKIVDGELVLSEVEKNGYKPVLYADIPAFDQTTQYVVQSAPSDAGEYIYMGVEVLELPERIDGGDLNI